jgi:hypothetical protein
VFSFFFRILPLASFLVPPPPPPPTCDGNIADVGVTTTLVSGV